MNRRNVLKDGAEIIFIVISVILMVAMIGSLVAMFVLLGRTSIATDSQSVSPAIVAVDECGYASYSIPFTAYTKQSFDENYFIQCLKEKGYRVTEVAQQDAPK